MLKYLLQNASLMTLYPSAIEQGDLRIADGKIVEKGVNLESEEDEIVLDLSGKMLLPGMVCAHTHLYSALSRGMPGPDVPPVNFQQILEKVWWKLDKALDEESIYYSTVVGVLDAIATGTTTIIDHHASPGQIAGSLQIMKEVFEKFGVRGVLCYEVTDRGGMDERNQGITENRWMLGHQSDMVKGLVGAHAAFTLSDESLRMCAELMKEFKSGLHIHIAEGSCDVEISHKKYGKGLVARLCDLGALNDKSLLVHGVHLTDEELQQAADLGCWLIHNPRSNMNNSVGYAPLAKLGSKTALGTDGITSNMFEESKFMFFKVQDAKVPFGAEDCMRFLNGGHRMAAEMFGLPLGTLDAGAAADLIVLDYPSPTPVNPGNLPWHFIFGITHAHVESVMTAGEFLVKERQFVHPGARSLYQEAQSVAEKLWRRVRSVV